MLKDFKEFALKGNVVDLAVGVIIGAGFAKIIDSLVKDLIMPLVSMLTGGVDFVNKFAILKPGKDGASEYASLKAAQDAGATVFAYGNFVNNVVTFIILAFAVFMMIKALGNAKSKLDVAAPPNPSEVLLTEIRDLLKK